MVTGSQPDRTFWAGLGMGFEILGLEILVPHSQSSRNSFFMHTKFVKLGAVEAYDILPNLTV